MSYMRPSYVRFHEFDTEHTRFATKYGLYLYREHGVDDESKLHGIPVLFIPGNAGSYKQVRPIAAEAANYFHEELRHDASAAKAGIKNLDFFTVDFNEDITAFHGQTLLDQAEYLNEAIRFILSLYTDPQRVERDSHLPDPTSVIIVGHSMGGVVARAMLVQPNYQPNSINTIITMSAPHARPPVTFDKQIVQIYDEINEYWREAYTQKWANNNPLWQVTLVSIAGGNLDVIVPSDYASLESLVPHTHGFTVFASSIPTVWTSMDHQAIMWCDQFRKVMTKALFEVVDVNRAAQTKPRAERMRVFEKYFLTGLEPTAQKTLPAKEATTLLTLDDEANGIVPAGQGLVLSTLGGNAKPKAHLLPVPPETSPISKRFTLLTDARLDDEGENGQLEVLFCSVAPLQPGAVGAYFTLNMDLSGDTSGSTRLACKNAASDAIALPASTEALHQPFYLEGEAEIRPFSYLQYSLESLGDHQFVAVVDKSTTLTRNFVIAEFTDESVYRKAAEVSFQELVTDGLTLHLPADRPMTMEVSIPSMSAALIAYDLDVSRPQCQQGGGQHFAPLVRQFLEKPYESRYFVNVRQAKISLHGDAPFMPPSLDLAQPRRDAGVSLEFWTDPTCNAPIEVTIKVNVLRSLGNLYMRYRTVFAAFPLLIVTLVLRKQFRVYDEQGIFISFSRSLDMSLRQSIPLLLLSLTLLSMSVRGPSMLEYLMLWRQTPEGSRSHLEYQRNDLLVGTDEAFFWFLIPIIGIVCIAVCSVLHFMVLVLTGLLSLIYRVVDLVKSRSGRAGATPVTSTTFARSTPRRRMITTAVLLFLVSTFIPYQFAYLVACLVQLFTVVRAMHIHATSPSANNLSYFNYAHSILLLMLWVLPINLPILAVWVRNLAVHWLTPFSSHHNVLSIMPFILLVENMTTGRMVPRVTSWLRHVTSILLFSTALCAAIYGISHAYVLHYLVNFMAAWLVLLHSTSREWSVKRLFENDAEEKRENGKKG